MIDIIGVMAYNRRFCDLREKGIMTKKKPLGKGLYEYSLERAA